MVWASKNGSARLRSIIEQTRTADYGTRLVFTIKRHRGQEEFWEESARLLEAKNILTVPAWMKHYRNLPLPPYVEPLSFMGVTDDLTSDTRLDEDGVSYIKPPSPDLDYFSLSIAKDPRPLIVHEGVPGHYFQMTLSWAHENKIRRRYYDSGANEGIGFYAEEDAAVVSSDKPSCARSCTTSAPARAAVK